MMEETENSTLPTTALPLARVKKIMKSDEDSGNVSSDAVFLTAKATVK